jgi:hypothetical protein
MSSGWHNDFERHSLARQWIKTVFVKQPRFSGLDSIFNTINESEKRRAIVEGENNFLNHADYSRFYFQQIKNEKKKLNPNKLLIDYYYAQLKFHSKFRPTLVIQKV